DLETAEDTLGKGLVKFIGREFAIGVKDVGRGDEIEFGPVPGEVLHQMLMGLYLGVEIPPKGRNDHLWANPFQDPIDIVLFQVVAEKLFVVPEGTLAEIGAVGVKIGAEVPVNGVPHKSTPAQYQYLLF